MCLWRWWAYNNDDDNAVCIHVCICVYVCMLCAWGYLYIHAYPPPFFVCVCMHVYGLQRITVLTYWTVWICGLVIPLPTTCLGPNSPLYKVRWRNRQGNHLSVDYIFFFFFFFFFYFSDCLYVCLKSFFFFFFKGNKKKLPKVSLLRLIFVAIR